MTSAPSWVEVVTSTLLPALAQAGLRVDARVTLLVEAWLLEAVRRGALGSGSAEGARAALRAIVAKSVREQALFDEVFTAWIAGTTDELAPHSPPEPVPAPLSVMPANAGTHADRPRWPQAWILAFARMTGWDTRPRWELLGNALGVLLIVAGGWMSWNPRTLVAEDAVPVTFTLDNVKSVAGQFQLDDGSNPPDEPAQAASDSHQEIC